jgi:hypothetical protein
VKPPPLSPLPLKSILKLDRLQEQHARLPLQGQLMTAHMALVTPFSQATSDHAVQQPITTAPAPAGNHTANYSATNESTAGSATHLYWPYLESPSLSPLPLKSILKLDRLQNRQLLQLYM